MNWDEAQQAFAEQTRQRLRPSTIDSALRQVKRFRNFHPDLAGPTEVGPGHLVAFLESESRRATVKAAWHYVIDLKCFFRWATRARVVHWNPTAELRPPKFHTARVPLSYAQVEAVLSQPEPQSRDAAILEVFYGTGVRLGEAVGLDVHDVDLLQLRLHVRHTKGGNPRLTPIGDHLAEVLRHYLEHVRPAQVKNVAEPALWLSATGTRLSHDTIATKMSQYFRQAGLLGVSPHTFRHSYATHLLEGGAPLLVVQTLLGHRSLVATQAYTHILQLELLREYRRTHPRAKRRGRRA